MKVLLEPAPQIVHPEALANAHLHSTRRPAGSLSDHP